ncbi:MAG: thioredoxin family protein [Coriobacteriia bacterium]
MDERNAGPAAPKSSRGGVKVIVALVAIALVLGGIAFGKNFLKDAPASGSQTATQNQDADEEAADQDSSSATAPSITAEKNDFAADYQAALASGKPVFVYFHTETCPSCKAFSPIIEKVMPDFEGKVVFVNAFVDESRAASDLATEHEFQYVPTSLFLKPGGEEDSSFVGPMTENELRRKLSTLSGQ